MCPGGLCCGCEQTFGSSAILRVPRECVRSNHFRLYGFISSPNPREFFPRFDEYENQCESWQFVVARNQGLLDRLARLRLSLEAQGSHLLRSALSMFHKLANQPRKR